MIWKAEAPLMALEAVKNPSFRPEELTPPLDLLSVLCQGSLLPYFRKLRSSHFNTAVQECKTEYGRRIIDAVDAILPLSMEHTKLMAHTLTLAVLVCENLGSSCSHPAVDSVPHSYADCVRGQSQLRGGEVVH